MYLGHPAWGRTVTETEGDFGDHRSPLWVTVAMGWSQGRPGNLYLQLPSAWTHTQVSHCCLVSPPRHLPGHLTVHLRLPSCPCSSCPLLPDPCRSPGGCSGAVRSPDLGSVLYLLSADGRRNVRLREGSGVHVRLTMECSGMSMLPLAASSLGFRCSVWSWVGPNLP